MDMREGAIVDSRFYQQCVLSGIMLKFRECEGSRKGFQGIGMEGKYH